MPVTYCDVFAFLWRSIQTMNLSCFFDCFRVRNNNNDHHHYQDVPDSPSNEEGAQKLRLSLLFTDEGKEECAVEERENLVQRVAECEIDEGLVEEAKFLKACGTLQTTPAEIRKAVKLTENLERSGMQRPQSMLESSSETPVEIQKTVMFAENLEKSDIQRPHSVLKSSFETPAEVQKTVTFTENLEESDTKRPHDMLNSSAETPPGILEAGTLLDNIEISDSCGPQSVLESSPETPEEIRKPQNLTGNLEKSDIRRTGCVITPYPTPRRITDDMQTPGTVYATNMKSLTKGNARIRSQYVYTNLNPVENLGQQEELAEDYNVQHGQSDREGENLPEQGSATPLSAMGPRGASATKENIGDVSLSSWLKPPLPKADGVPHNLGPASYRKPNVGRTPGDRPIFGLLATNWNEEKETCHFSPKWWDGNGIPNSTTKYKEDQKVRWHATPFEERLEKALSEETSVPKRKPITGTPIVFEDAEENAAAAPQLQAYN